MKEIFDDEFCSKLKAFCYADGSSYYSTMKNYRRTGRTKKLSKILLEIAIESRQDIFIMGHDVDSRLNNRRMDEHMKRAIYDRVEDYARIGVIIECRFKNETFSATIYSGREIYDRHRIKPFQTNKQEKEYSKNKLLLLLY